METKSNIKKIVIGTFAIAAAGLIGGAGIVNAYQGNPSDQGPNFDADSHDEKTAAFNELDYQVWKDLMEQSGSTGKVLDMVNADNFAVFVEAHNAALTGDMETSAKLRAEIGLNDGIGPSDGTGYKNGDQSQNKGTQGSKQMNQANFVDTNADGTCDNDGLSSKSNERKGGRN